MLLKSQNSDPLEAVICSVSPGRASQTCSGHQSPLKAVLHSPYSVCHHSNTAEGQLDKKQLISSVSGNTQLGPLLSNCTSQNFLKTETVKASPWWGCSVYLQSATAGPLILYICTVTLCWVLKVIVMSSEPQVVLHFHKVLLSTRYSLL